jgi:hypothetical protein
MPLPDSILGQPSEDPAHPAATMVLAPQQPLGLSWYDGLDVDAYLSAGYLYRRLQAPDLAVGLEDINVFVVDTAQLVFAAEATRPYDVGFTFELVGRHALLRRTDTYGMGLRQLNLSTVLPLHRGLTVQAGRFDSRLGSESLPGYASVYDTGATFLRANLQHSSGLLFGSMPTLLTGVRLGLLLTSVWQLDALVANGWQSSWLDNNLAKTFGLQLGGAWANGTQLAVHYLLGAERPSNNVALRHLGNVVLSRATRWGGLKAEGLLATQQNGAAPQWRLGAQVSARLNVSQRSGLSLRAEYLDNRRGWDASADQDPRLPTYLTAQPAEIVALTVTPSLQLHDSLVLQVEGRYDGLLRAGPVSRTRALVGANGHRAAAMSLGAALLFVF